MSMITGCPACGTMFRVVPDQLKISDGWVRCGHCGEVFDASAHLRPEASQPPAADDIAAAATPVDDVEGLEVALPAAAPSAPPVPASAPAAAPVPATVPEASAEREPPPDIAPDSAHGFADAEFGEDALTPEEEEAFIQPRYSRLDDSGGDAVPPASGFARSGFTPSGFEASAPAASTPASSWPTSRPFAPSTIEKPLDDADPDDLSFVQQARRHAFWRRPVVRVLMAVAAVLLGVLLAAQYGVRERDRLALQHPSLRPWLLAACMPLGCKLGPPQRIAAILIDNSGFTRLRPDTYRLSFSLRNQADHPVAVPSLQLTLTDIQEQPVLQRVLTPQELGAPSDTIAPASDFSASIALAVGGESAGGRIAGYRLLAFYP